MRYKITVPELKNIWQKLSDSLDGELKFCEKIRAEVDANIITAEVKFNYKGFKILIHQGILQGGKGHFRFNPIDISINIKRSIDFNISIWKIDFLDKIFNWNRIKTGNKDFDRQFGVAGQNKRAIARLFNYEKVRDLFLQDIRIVFNVRNSNDTTIIRLRGNYDSIEIKDLNYLKDSFLLLIDSLMEIKVIKPPLAEVGNFGGQ
ncbi:hypothetical protein [Carboxylicivirga taeanensis]|uniref:hypothetical protein n=1 Tax=Carboxylicivirga taeanensis TaxID=1416875 RepID=UPI003F6DFB27